MAKARSIAKRRKAVNNIRKITHTMQLIATARFQKSLNRAVGTRPYTDKITELVQQVSRAGESIRHPLLTRQTDVKRQAVLLITSNRGLCGGYNASLFRTALSAVGEVEPEGVATDLHVVGKKGVIYFKFMGRELAKTYPAISDSASFADVEPIATAFMNAYCEGRYRAVRVVYMKFLSTARQKSEVIQLLPIEALASSPDSATTADKGAAAEVMYDFSPPPELLLAELLPETVKVRLFQCFCDATVSENVARMVAMKSATDSAGDMSKMLGQRYNRARQSQITMELLDIMGGVEALK